jgi:hypothetical protein
MSPPLMGIFLYPAPFIRHQYCMFHKAF